MLWPRGGSKASQSSRDCGSGYKEFARLNSNRHGLDKLHDTAQVKQMMEGLPGSHIVVFFEGSTCYSMDTSQPTTKNEYAVFEFDFEDPKESLKRVADSFCEFFIRYFENEKTMKKLIG